MRQPIAEAMVEEATRPTMRFVALKFEAQQARAMLFRTRQMFIGQRTQTINALRGHLAEYGVVEPKGAIHVKRLADAVTDETIGLPEDVRELAQVYLAQIEDLNVQITALDQKMKGAAKEAEAARRAQTMPGVGPITALAIETFAPDLRRTAMKDYIGLDVSMKETAISIRRGGARVWRGKFNSDPARIAQIVRKRAPNVERVVFETGPLSVWFYHALKEEGLPAICIDARHGKAALDMAANKTDANDADGLAQLAEVGFYREVRVKGYDSMLARSLIAARTRLVRITVELSNQIRGLMKTFGLMVPSGKGRNFDTNVRRLLVDQTELSNIILPLLYAWHDMRMRAADLTKLLLAVARKSPACRLLMTIPGVGAITATSYATAIEDPSNFKNSRAVGAWLGLTSRRYQSGEVDYSGRVSRRGDRHLRGLLYEAALVILTRSKKQSDLQTWALKLKERVGTKRAAVALARKLAVTMHAHAENRIRVQS